MSSHQLRAVLLSATAALLGTASVAHMMGYEKAMQRLSTAALPTGLVRSVQALWLGNSIFLAALALLSALSAARPLTISPLAHLIVSLLLIGVTALLYWVLGTGAPAHIMLGATMCSVAACTQTDGHWAH